MAPPLEGIRILDLSRLAPGPYCTMILGDLGADVIKIEDARESGLGVMSLVYGDVSEEKIAAYDAHGRNKRSIALNLRFDESKKIFYKLCENVDVVVEGFRPGVVKRLGVDYETVKGINPRIIYCSLSGYGQDGPYEALAGHDINYISIAGAQGIIGQRGGPPTIPSNLLGDFAGGGMHAAIGILAALMARERTGRGQLVDIAMTDGVVSLLAAEASTYFLTGKVPRPGQTMTLGAAPYYNMYETKDGKYIAIGCLEPRFYENLCRALGREDFITHQEADEEKQKEIFSAFREIFLTRTRDEWFDLLRQTDICVAPVYSLDEAFSDPQVVHRNMVVEIDHPTQGKVRQVGISIKLSETPGAIRSPAPLRGQDTEEILGDLGYTTESISELRKAGAII